MMTASTYRKWAAEMRALSRWYTQIGKTGLSDIALASACTWEARARVVEMFKT